MSPLFSGQFTYLCFMDRASDNVNGLPELEDGRLLILFDGYCNLCNGAVQFVLKRDRRDRFRFAALSWPAGEALKQHFPELRDVDSIVLYDGNKVWVRSDAALRIALKLGALWPMWGIGFILPRFLRDAVYKWVAKNRYRWFGKKELCMMPTEETARKFLRKA